MFVLQLKRCLYGLFINKIRQLTLYHSFNYNNEILVLVKTKFTSVTQPTSEVTKWLSYFKKAPRNSPERNFKSAIIYNNFRNHVFFIHLVASYHFMSYFIYFIQIISIWVPINLNQPLLLLLYLRRNGCRKPSKSSRSQFFNLNNYFSKTYFYITKAPNLRNSNFMLARCVIFINFQN